MKSVRLSPRVSAFPTVEWLRSRSSWQAGDRAPRARGSQGRLRNSGDSPAKRLSGWIDRLSPDTTGVRRDVWVATPDGERHVDVIVEHGERRLAIRFTGRYERDVELEDAVVLVYGRFDAVFRVRGGACSQALRDVLYAVVCEKPTWFFAAGRGASAAAPLKLNGAAERSATGCSLLRTQTLDLRRCRLSRANEWVQTFERALGRGPSAGPKQ